MKGDIERKLTSSGAETIIVNGQYFHSRVDPRKEATRAAVLVDPEAVVILLSPGMGYLADALAPRRVICLERHFELAALRSDLKTYVHPDPEEIARIISDLAEETRPKFAIISGAHLAEDGAYYDAIRGTITRAIEKSVERILTMTAFAGLWEKNLSANVIYIRGKNTFWISSLDSRLRGKDVVILSAGPSLHDDLPLLVSHPRRSVLCVIAVDSALPATISSGVCPDYVISIDPQPVKAAVLERLGDIPLIASVLSPPEILSMASTLFLFGQGHPGEAAIGISEAETMSDVGGSVATAAATLCVRCGVKTLVLVGQDLALKGQRTHARGSVQEFSDRLGLQRFSTMEHAKMRTMKRKNLRSVPSVDGGTVMTTPVMDSYRIYFEELASRHPETRCVHTSPSGAAIAMEHLRLSEWLNENPPAADRIT